MVLVPSRGLSLAAGGPSWDRPVRGVVKLNCEDLLRSTRAPYLCRDRRGDDLDSASRSRIAASSAVDTRSENPGELIILDTG